MLQITVVHTLAPEVLELFAGLIQNRNNAPSVPAVTQQPATTDKPVEAKPKPKATPASKASPDVETLPPFDPEAHFKDFVESNKGKALLKDFPVENQHSVSDFEKQEAPKDEAPATTGKAYTLEEVRAAAVAKTREGEAKRDAVKALITEYGATAISTLDKGHYGEFMTKLNAI